MKNLLPLILFILPFLVTAQSTSSNEVEEIPTAAADSLPGSVIISVDKGDSIQTALQHQLDSLDHKLSRVQLRLDSLKALGQGNSKQEDSLSQVQKKGQAVRHSLLQQQQDVSAPLANVDGVQQSQTSGAIPDLDILKDEGYGPLLPVAKIPGVEMPSGHLAISSSLDLPTVSKPKEVADIASLDLPELNLTQSGSPTIDSSYIDKDWSSWGEDQIKSSEKGRQFQDELLGANDSAILKGGEPHEGAEALQTLVEDKNVDDVNLEQVVLKQKLKLVANDKLSLHVDKLQAAQEELNKLKKKYREVPNSNELKSALKYGSLKDKTFAQRLELGLNIQFLHTKPLVMDLSPNVGYRFNKQFQAGVGVHWRFPTSGRRVPLIIPSRTVGCMAYASHSLWKSFFVHAVYERHTERSPGTPSELQNGRWLQAGHLGLGKRMKINSRLASQALILYNVLHDRQQPLYSTLWNLRVSMQIRLGSKYND